MHWSLLIVIAYIPIGEILEELLERWNILGWDKNEGLAIFTILLWPLMFPICLLITVTRWVSGSTDDDDWVSGGTDDDDDE